jgi:tetratricopeptide (TPR) repeat protein
MKTNKLWAIGLSGLLMTAGIPSQIAVALSASEVSTKAKEFTVQIDGDGGVGSGVLFDRQGDTYYVLTNRHVVSQDGRYEIQTPSGDRYPVYYSQVIPEMDLAILQFNSKKTYRLAQLGNSDGVREGMSVYVVGWAGSLPGINERSYQITDGRIRSLLSRPDDGYAMVYNNEAIPGMSGGPVLNEDGLVVGINGRATPPEEKTGTVLRLGIPINSFVAARKKLPSDGGQTIATSPPNPDRIETSTNPPPVNNNKAPTAEQFVSLGGSKSGKQDYQGAIEAYNRALDLDKNNPDAYFGRGVARSQLQQFEPAIEDFSQVIRLSPKNAFAYGYRGLIKVYLQDYKGALDDSDKAISLDPKSPNSAPAYGVRGMANIGLENYRGAVADFDQVIKQFPDQADFYALRGLSRGAAGDRAGVIPDVQKAADLYKKAGRTKDYENAQTIATSMQSIPSSVDTASIFQVALKAALQSLKPGGGGSTPAPTNNRTETTPPATQAATGNIDRTPPASQSPPGELKDAVAYFNRAVDNYKAGKKPEALADLNQAIRLDPKYSQAWYNRGLVLVDLGQPDQALASYDRAIAANNRWVGSKLNDVYVSKGVLLSERQNHKAAIAAYSQAIRLDAKDSGAYYGRGFSYYKLKDHRRAIDDYTTSIKLNPKGADGYLSRGFARYERGDLTGTVADIRQALVTYKNSPGLHLALGMALYKQGKREEGLKLAEKAIDLDRRVTDLQFLKQYNWGDRLLADTDKLLKNPRLTRRVQTSGV